MNNLMNNPHIRKSINHSRKLNDFKISKVTASLITNREYVPPERINRLRHLRHCPRKQSNDINDRRDVLIRKSRREVGRRRGRWTKMMDM